MRLLSKQGARCALCGDHLLPADRPPHSPHDWERWWRNVIRTAMVTDHSVARGRPGPSGDAHNREDVGAGYVYELAFRQFEVSDTRVFDRPAAGRSFFEQLIRDHLDVGRPESVSLSFDRRIIRTTPGTWRTKVITQGVDPQISCYKSSRIKQYFKEHRALRNETVICDTRDFGIGRRVTAENWKALRAVGEQANQRLCDAQAADARPAPDVATFTEVTGRASLTASMHCASGSHG